MSRAKTNASYKPKPYWTEFLIQQGFYNYFFINDNRCTFYNFPNTSSIVFPSKNTFRPNNHGWFHRRNQDKRLYLYTLLPILQISFRISRICIVKKAYIFSFAKFFFYYTLKPKFLQPFFIRSYKIAFPDKKLSKNPCTSKPTFSKLPIKFPTVAILKRFCV